MATAIFHKPIGTVKQNPTGNEWGTSNKLRNHSLKLTSNPFGVDIRLSNLHVLHASPSHSSHVDVLTTTASADDYQTNTSEESTLVLIRHGESPWNDKNLFTGWVDVPITKKGIEEALEAGKRISNIPIDIIYTSELIRAQMTTMLLMTQHLHQKVPIIQHNESYRAKKWSRIYSEETIRESIPVITAWELNERMYGELQGFNKEETAERYGHKIVHEWRKSFDVPPPNGESLEMCSQRAVAYFKQHVEPKLESGMHVMVVSHANTLRSIIMYLDKLTADEVPSLELPTGVPLLYIYKDGEYIRRGSLVGSAEVGVYAYTENLALYKEKFEELFRNTTPEETND